MRDARKFFTVESEEDGEGGKVAGVETERLACRGIGEVLGGEESKSPTVHSNICSKLEAVTCSERAHLPCVAAKNTSDVNTKVNHVKCSSGAFINASELYAIQSMSEPMMSCMGTIHDFRRPTLRKNLLSTMGDQRSLKE